MELVLSLALFLVGLVLLERGADLFNDRVGELVERTGVSETVVGLITIGIEWEELAVSLVAVVSGSPALAVGNIIGSSIANLTGSFSLGLLARPIRVLRDDRRLAAVTVALTLLSAVLLARGEVGRAEGTLLVVIFLVYLAAVAILMTRGLFQPKFQRDEEDDGHYAPLGDLLLAFAGLVLILVGAEAVVQAGLSLALAFGLSEFVVGLTLVAFGTALPDTVIAVTGALRGRSGVVMANALGSNISNLTAVLGLTALTHPLTLDDATRTFDLPFLVGVTLLTALLFLRNRVGRTAGAGLLGLYIIYLWVNLWVKP